MATTNGAGGVMIAPERNNFFYGKLMDVTQFEKEQRYFNHKRMLLNRLVLGGGVACGLKLDVDSQATGKVRIEPGVAIDGLGREIVVPGALSIDPHQLTDDQGKLVGDPITTGTVTICLAYAEGCADLVPVLVPDCDTPGNCAASTIREGFRILVRLAGGAAPDPPTCALADGFPSPAPETPVPEALHRLLCDRVGTPCPEIPEDPCVPLGRVNLDDLEEGSTGSIDSCAGRALIYNNALLYELILCLAARVDELVGGP